jgi:hypothetical protein
MPPRRRAQTPGIRAGARPGEISSDLTAALRDEQERLAELPSALDQAVAVGDPFAALDDKLDRIALIRIQAVISLHRGGMSQKDLTAALSLSKGRISQILRDPRFTEICLDVYPLRWRVGATRANQGEFDERLISASR